MKLKPTVILIVIFSFCDVTIFAFPSIPSLPPSLSNLFMIKRLIKFYTLQSKSERSELCEKQTKLLYDAVSNSDLWGQRMIDASAKLQSGLTKFHLSDVGYFDECIEIRNENISVSGKYCLATISLQTNKFADEKLINDFQQIVEFSQVPMGRNLFDEDLRQQTKGRSSYITSLSWAICVPDGCTAKEVQDHLNTFAGVDIFTVKESKCQTKETSKSTLNPGDWVVLTFLTILCVIMLLSTIYDVYLYYMKNETNHQILIAFSWLTNFQKLTKISNNPDMLPSLNGIRFLSMLWIISGHEYASIKPNLCVNLLDINDWMHRFSSMLTIGSTVSVDSFFLLSGCLLMYGFLKSQVKKIPFNIPLFYLHRYIRLTPSYAAAIVFSVTLYRFMGSGPFWDPENTNDSCRTNWWAALLYIQNYVDGANCVTQSWYLQIDMQLYILAPLVLLPVRKWPKLAPFILSALVFIFILIPTIVAWHYKLMVTMFGGRGGGDANQMDVYYGQTYTRAGPWVLGLLLGYILFNAKNKKIALNKIVVALLWIVSLGIMLYTVFGFYNETQPGYVYDRVFNAFFIGLHRVAWSAGLSWIIFACTYGYGGPVNWFLSLPIFQVLAKLTYSMYLTHIFLQQIHQNSLQMPFVFSNMHIWYSFCGTLINVLLVSIFWTLTFESPFIILDTLLMKLISGKSRKAVVSKPPQEVRQEIENKEQL